MKILKRCSKNLPFSALLFTIALLQSCKKEAANKAFANIPKQGMYALINDSCWTAKIVVASLQYDAVSAGKIFTCEGTMGNKVIQLMAFQNNAAAGNGFPLGPATDNLNNFGYFILPIHRNLTEQNVTLVTTPGAGMVITDIDTARQLISGTFKFPQADSAYDAVGNLTAVQNNLITNGVFKQVHYVYTR